MDDDDTVVVRALFFMGHGRASSEVTHARHTTEVLTPWINANTSICTAPPTCRVKYADCTTATYGSPSLIVQCTHAHPDTVITGTDTGTRTPLSRLAPPRALPRAMPHYHIPQGKPMIALGAINVGRNTSIGDQCSLFGGCIVQPFTEIDAHKDVYCGNENTFPRSPETSWTHGDSWAQLLLQSLVLGGLVLGLVLGALVLLSYYFVVPVIKQDDASGFSPAVAMCLLLLLGHIVALVGSALLFILFSQLIGCPPLYRDGQTRWLRIGSWRFFLHVLLRQAVVKCFAACTFHLQSCKLPAAILRAAGAKIGANSIVFVYDHHTELTVPLPMLSIGANTLVTTHVQLGVPAYCCGRWYINRLAVGDACLVGNNSILDARAEGLRVPDNTWIGALSDVCAASLPLDDAGAVLLGIPARALAVKPTVDLAVSAPRLPTVLPAIISVVWVAVLPLLCPTALEVSVVSLAAFYYAADSYALGWLLALGLALAAWLWATLVFGCVTRWARWGPVHDGSELPMFSRRWFVFHWYAALPPPPAWGSVALGLRRRAGMHPNG